MSTIINTNLSSLTAHRSALKQGAHSVSASERLATGARINRASDDAAGLAISERIRNQIRGMDQAVRNSQDGISLLQTGDGALEEMHRMLERVKELTVKAGNDINTPQDRANITKEISNILGNIENIAQNTKFNNISLFAGDNGITISSGEVNNLKSWKGFLSTAPKGNFSDVLMALGFGDPVTTPYGNTVNPFGDYSPNSATQDIKGSVDGLSTPASAINKQAVTDWLSNIVNNIPHGWQLEENWKASPLLDNLTNQYEIDQFITSPNGLQSLFTNISDSSDISQNNELFNLTNQLKEIQSMQNTVEESASALQDALTNFFEEKENNPIQDWILKQDWRQSLANTNFQDKNITNQILIDSQSFVQNYFENNNPEFKQVLNFVGYNGSIVGIANEDIPPSITNGDAFVAWLSSPEVSLKLTGTGWEVLNPITSPLNLNNFSDIESLLNSNTFSSFFRYTGKNAYIDVNEQSINYQTIDMFDGSVRGNISNNYRTLGFQTGSNSMQRINVNLHSMNLDSLGIGNAANRNPLPLHPVPAPLTEWSNPLPDANSWIDEFGLASTLPNPEAGIRISRLISELENAVSRVSSQRAYLGAAQNRIEHAINYLQIASENLSLANSRIRDTDMALEFMNMTKADVLQQAAFAMLTQSNMQPQGVLQLLQ